MPLVVYAHQPLLRVSEEAFNSHCLSPLLNSLRKFLLTIVVSLGDPILKLDFLLRHANATNIIAVRRDLDSTALLIQREVKSVRDPECPWQSGFRRNQAREETLVRAKELTIFTSLDLRKCPSTPKSSG